MSLEGLKEWDLIFMPSAEIPEAYCSTHYTQLKHHKGLIHHEGDARKILTRKFCCLRGIGRREGLSCHRAEKQSWGS